MGTANCFYAVRKGVRPGIYESWDECKPNVHKFKGCIFAKFKTRKEASSYMQAKTISPVIKKKLPVASPVQAMGMPSQAIPYPRSETRDASLLSLAREFVSLAREAEAEDIPKLQDIRTDAGELPLICEMARRYADAVMDASALDPSTYQIYTDGSSSNHFHGWSFVVYSGKRIIFSDSGSSKNRSKKICAEAGETEAVMHAVMWAKMNSVKAFTILYDFAGLTTWVLRGSKSQNESIRQYADWMNRELSCLNVEFRKVKGHSGIPGNVEADRLAKEAVRSALS